jgi:hypothetical protein
MVSDERCVIFVVLGQRSGKRELNDFHESWWGSLTALAGVMRREVRCLAARVGKGTGGKLEKSGGFWPVRQPPKMLVFECKKY